MRLLNLYALSLLLLASLTICAQTKKAASSGIAAPVIREATEQRSIPGSRETEGYTQYRFVIIWKGKTAPTGFYWHPDAKNWMKTDIAQPERRPGLAPGDYMTIERHIPYESVRYGDTLILNTLRHEHDPEPMPSIVKNMPVKSLYYQTAAAPGKWMSTPVALRKMPDIHLR